MGESVVVEVELQSGDPFQQVFIHNVLNQTFSCDFQVSIRLSMFSGSGKFHHDLQYAEPTNQGSQIRAEFDVLTSQQLYP